MFVSINKKFYFIEKVLYKFKKKFRYLLRRYRLALEAYMEAEKASNKQDWEIYHNIGKYSMFNA